MNRPELPREISAEAWKRALDLEREQDERMAKLRKPGELPIVSTVEQQILEELLDEKAKDQAESQARKSGGLSE